MYLIVASNLNGGIGKDGTIPWELKEDMDYFRAKTMFGVLIMGRKTFESLPRLLPNRVHIVVSKTLSPKEGVYVESTFHAAWQRARTFDKEVWVIGGSKIYEEAFRHFALEKVYHTLVQNTHECDTFIKIPSNIEWKTVHTSEKAIYKVGTGKKGIEQQYLSLVDTILQKGDRRQTRSGETLSIFSAVLDIDLSKGFPLLTTKKMFWKGIVEELLFFVRGDTDTNTLKEKGVRIWEGNTTRAFLDRMGLAYPEGHMGPMYGYQWRFFGKPYNEKNGGIDQLYELIEEIRRDKHSRRLLMTTYNPAQVREGVLYPCHSLILQFYIEGNKLSCAMYQRSADVFLGLPFNIASTSLLLHMIASITKLEVGTVHLHLGDAHIYTNHLPAIHQQLSRTPYDLPTLHLPSFTSIKDIETSRFDEYALENYKSHPAIKAEMNV
jgi:dihydrofolate reductase/thymidylate synthase